MAALVVWLFAGYQLLFAFGCVWRRQSMRAFLRAFAATRWRHYVELSVRIVLAVALLASAGASRMPWLLFGLGLVILLSSVVLLLLPWTWHRAWAERLVPAVSERIGLLAAPALLLAMVLLWALR